MLKARSNSEAALIKAAATAGAISDAPHNNAPHVVSDYQKPSSYTFDVVFGIIS